jgi:hypothetical protein
MTTWYVTSVAWLVLTVPLLAQPSLDEILTGSQFYLAGAGSAETVAHSLRFQTERRSDTLASLGALGLTIALERVTQHKWGRKAKIAVAVVNIAAGTVLTGYARRDFRIARQELPGAP